MQWTGGGLVPAVGIVPNAGDVKGGFVDGDVYGGDPVEVRVSRKPGPNPSPKITPKSVVALAKARLRAVKAEIKRLKALEEEKGELERLIAAAANKPKTNLREIKRSVG